MRMISNYMQCKWWRIWRASRSREDVETISGQWLANLGSVGEAGERRVRHNQQHVFRQPTEHLGHEACRTAASTSVNRTSIQQQWPNKPPRPISIPFLSPTQMRTTQKTFSHRLLYLPQGQELLIGQRHCKPSRLPPLRRVKRMLSPCTRHPYAANYPPSAA